ncbi:hypothetical protein NIES4071_95120 [Calothrix sp. NIES-4071]|nr:hypothetical protein NIES4071_95120 [Calothrix sp. NIES-4071]BAZ63777.1 hypothetical protein NIES4105_95050 [Calothrix sp. NIES-4105]
MKGFKEFRELYDASIFEFINSHLRALNAHEMNLKGADFRGAYLPAADFQGANE